MLRLFLLIWEWFIRAESRVHHLSTKKAGEKEINEWIRIEYPEESKVLTIKQILEQTQKPR